MTAWLAGKTVGILNCVEVAAGGNTEQTRLGIVVVALDKTGYGEPIAEWSGYLGHWQPANRFHLADIIKTTDFLVSHNARRDSEILGKFVPEAARRRWRCSLTQWVWPDVQAKTVVAVCEHLSVTPPEGGHVLANAHALRMALMVRRGGTERSQTYLSSLLKSFDYWVEGEPGTGEKPVVSIHWYNGQYVAGMQVGDRLNLEIGPSNYDIEGIVPDGRGTWRVLKIRIQGNEWIYRRIASGQELDIMVEARTERDISFGIVLRATATRES
ncbi:hypothetical protein [Stenotrophomonas sp.]|uniref:hypothetical protein n=1 Tax=Stenotrophomonas sp. TaxID=69392 RepID=UPI0028B1194D|nr:hypothetical protein [Stenotrophomonas sp.]